MKSKKLVIALIIIILILILAVGGVAFAYVTTDFLKTDEQLFYKYAGQIGTKLQGFDSEELKAYFEKLEKVPYESKGKISVDVDIPNANKEYLDKINNLNITFSGKTDKANKLSQNSIKINYSDNVAFPIEYRQNGDLFGITSDIVLKKYIAVNNSNVYELLSKLVIVNPDVLDVQDKVSNISLSELMAEFAKLKTVLTDNIQATNFSKSDKGYTVTLNEKETMTILIKLLEELENSNILPEESNQTLDLLLSNLEEELEDSTTDTLLRVTVSKNNVLEIEIVDIGTINVTVVNDNQILMTLKTDETGEITFRITKNVLESQISYRLDSDIVLEEEALSTYFETRYSNIAGQNAQETYAFGIALLDEEEGISYDYNIDISKKFSDTLNIEKISNNDALVLNDASTEYINIVIPALINQVVEINNAQMQQLGLEGNQNPLLYATPLTMINYLIGHMPNDINGDDIEDTTNIEAMLAHNARFEPYAGMQTGLVVKTLVQTVISSNTATPDHIVSINGLTGEAGLTSYASTLNSSQTYNVILNMNEDTGYIDTINII